jgi:hypothetical protein
VTFYNAEVCERRRIGQLADVSGIASRQGGHGPGAGGGRLIGKEA